MYSVLWIQKHNTYFSVNVRTVPKEASRQFFFCAPGKGDRAKGLGEDNYGVFAVVSELRLNKNS